MDNSVLVVVLFLLGALAFSYVPMAISAMRKRRRGITRVPRAPGSTDWSWTSGADTASSHHHAASTHHHHAAHHCDPGAGHHGGGFSGGHH